jgi:hypothetical protein
MKKGVGYPIPNAVGWFVAYGVSIRMPDELFIRTPWLNPAVSEAPINL